MPNQHPSETLHEQASLYQQQQKLWQQKQKDDQEQSLMMKRHPICPSRKIVRWQDEPIYPGPEGARDEATVTEAIDCCTPTNGEKLQNAGTTNNTSSSPSSWACSSSLSSLQSYKNQLWNQLIALRTSSHQTELEIINLELEIRGLKQQLKQKQHGEQQKSIQKNRNKKS